MAKVFIVPLDNEAARENFAASVETGGYEFDALGPWVNDKSLIDLLGQHYPDGKCFAWGLQEETIDNLKTWNAMVADDLVLFYLEGSIVSASYVRMKINDPSLAARLWSGNSKEPSGLICFTDKPYLGEVPIIPQMFSYLDPEYKDFAELSSNKLGNIMRDYGSLETFIHLCLRYDFPFSLRHT
jgi:hypothetical protein